MTFGTNGNPIGIVPNSLTTESDNFLFNKMTSLFGWCTNFDMELFVVGTTMITKFQSNTGGTFESAVLNSKVKASSAFKNFVKQFAQDLDNKFVASGGNINNVQDFEVNFRPVFNGAYNKSHGLQILINDTEFTEIQLDNFTNLPNGDWTADVTVIIHDHFGLDKNDALTYQTFHQGFPSWWILQHMRNYKPFETIVTVRQNITFHH